MGIRTVQANVDGLFGADDFTLTPQFYHPALAHLPFIRTMPDDPAERGVLWMRLSLEDKSVLEVEGFQASYRLNPQLAQRLMKSTDKLIKSCVDLRSKSRYPQTFVRLKELCSSLNVLAWSLNDSVVPYRVLIYLWAGYQRHFLETLAMYDFLSKWAQAMKFVSNANESKPRLGSPEYMGTIVTDRVMLRVFYALRIKVWYLGPSPNVPRTIAIVAVVHAESSTFSRKQADPPYPVLRVERAGPRTCVATQDLVVGGLAYGLDTNLDEGFNPQTLHPLAVKHTGLSRIEAVSSHLERGRSWKTLSTYGILTILPRYWTSSPSSYRERNHRGG